MSDLKTLFIDMLENKKILAATVAGLFIGAFFGVLAFYNGWLG